MVYINFSCEKGKVTAALRALADAVEHSGETLAEYETYEAVAKIDYDN